MVQEQTNISCRTGKNNSDELKKTKLSTNALVHT